MTDKGVLAAIIAVVLPIPCRMALTVTMRGAKGGRWYEENDNTGRVGVQAVINHAAKVVMITGKLYTDGGSQFLTVESIK